MKEFDMKDIRKTKFRLVYKSWNVNSSININNGSPKMLSYGYPLNSPMVRLLEVKNDLFHPKEYIIIHISVNL